MACYSTQARLSSQVSPNQPCPLYVMTIPYSRPPSCAALTLIDQKLYTPEQSISSVSHRLLLPTPARLKKA